MTNLNASSRIMFEEAERRGIECTTFGDRETILMASHGQRWYTRGSRTSLQSSVGKTIADNKDLTKKILHHFQLPTARHIKVSAAEDLSQLSELQFPVVMKPLDERHGKGVIVGLPSPEAARAAYDQQTYTKVLFEEMLVGTEYRIVCVNFKFVAAAFRKPAHVVGDGQHTVQELVDIKNQHPWRGKGHAFNLTLIEIDQLVLDLLQEQRLSLTSVPETGQEVKLRQTANLSTGGEAWDVTDQVSPENQGLFETIARACDLNVAGIDIMCQSLSQPITSQPQAGVIEVNASPGLRMHHFPVQGSARNVAGAILDMVEQYQHSSKDSHG